MNLESMVVKQDGTWVAIRVGLHMDSSQQSPHNEIDKQKLPKCVFTTMYSVTKRFFFYVQGALGKKRSKEK